MSLERSFVRLKNGGSSLQRSRKIGHGDGEGRKIQQVSRQSESISAESSRPSRRHTTNQSTNPVNSGAIEIERDSRDLVSLTRLGSRKHGAGQERRETNLVGLGACSRLRDGHRAVRANEVAGVIQAAEGPGLSPLETRSDDPEESGGRDARRIRSQTLRRLRDQEKDETGCLEVQLPTHANTVVRDRFSTSPMQTGTAPIDHPPSSVRRQSPRRRPFLSRLLHVFRT